LKKILSNNLISDKNIYLPFSKIHLQSKSIMQCIIESVVVMDR